MRSAKRAILTAGLALAAAAGLFASSGCRQYDLDLPPGEDSDLTVEQLMPKMSAATDPQGRFKNAKSYILKQKVVDSTKYERDEYSLEIKYKSPHFMKYTSFRGGKPFAVLLYDGKKAWNVDPSTGRSTEVAPGTGMNLVRTFAELARPGSSISSVFKEVSIDMVRDERDVLCYRLVCCVDDSNIAPYVIIVGPDFLTKSFETVLYCADGSQLKYLSTTGKYMDVDNIKMATENMVETGDKKVRSSMVSFTLDPEISDDEFKLPTPWYEKAREVDASKAN